MKDDKKKELARYDVVQTPKGFALNRNGKPLNTPAGVPMVLPTKALADVVASEYRAQPDDKPKYEAMPFTQLTLTALDLVQGKHEMVIAGLALVAESDLLCYRADPQIAEGGDLAIHQDRIWQSWLDWAAQEYKAPLKSGPGVMPLVQPSASLAALRKAVEAYDALYLVGLRQAVAVTGSLILGLALAKGKASAEKLFEAAEFDALTQMKQWGEDPVTLQRHASMRQELDVCEEWFRLLGKA